MSSPFDILKQPRAAVAQSERTPVYRRSPLVTPINSAPVFNTVISSRKESDRTLAIKGKL